MIQRLISTDTMERFIKRFKQQSDCLKLNGQTKYLSPNEAALIVDVINLWEQMKRDDSLLLTLSDKARLYPSSHIFPNSALDLCKN